MPTKFGAMVFALLMVTACGAQDETADTRPAAPKIGADVDTARIIAADQTPGDWLSYGRGYKEQRHSPLTAITPANVADLGVAWSYDLATARGVEATPIVVDGTMFVTSAWSVVYALDAVTGAEKWVYDPEVDRAWGVNACCDVVNRGVAIYGGRVYVGTIDGRLEALDADTGARLWSVNTIDRRKPYTITGAPRVAGGKVLIGNGGAELGVRGYLSAYDAATGDLVWRFYTTPNANKQPDGAASDAIFATLANDSWGDGGQWRTDGGGGTVWDSIIYDDVHDRIIFGVGNGSPWNQKLRDPSGGDNLFLSSIVAVDADTGAYSWHFQTTPGDNWDYTATQSLILADMDIGGKSRRVVMQAPKNGFFYVLDAATGEFLSGDAFVPMNWATGLTAEGRPIEVPDARYGTTPYMQLPGALGAHNWHPMAFDPNLGLAFIPAQEIPQAYAHDLSFYTDETRWNTGSDFAAGVPAEVPAAVTGALRASLKGRLIAWDVAARQPCWVVEHENAWNGGVLSTASGLVFQGKLGGDFAAYDASTGEKLWSADVKSGAASGPGTYRIAGQQYVTITTGWGSAYALVSGLGYDKAVPPTVGKVVTFKLGGTGTITAPDMVPIPQVAQTNNFGTADQIQAGNIHFQRNCGVCHGLLAVSSGVLPDLRWSATTADAALWQDIVIGGVLSGQGMVSFRNQVTAEEAEAIRAYVVSRAHESAALNAASSR